MKTRKGSFKFALWAGGFVAVLLVAVAVFVVIGMIDAPPPDESVLHLADLKAPLPEDNGFPDFAAAISALRHEVGDRKIDFKDDLDPATADELLAANAEAIGHVRAAAAKCGFFNPDWRESALENGGRELGLDFRAVRELLILLRLKARRCRENDDIDGALAVVDDMSAIADRLRDNARTKMEWLFGIGFQESADRACGTLVQSELLPRKKLALLRRAVFDRIGRWQGSVDRTLVAETATVLGGLDNWTAANFRGSEAFLPFLPWRFQFHPNRSKALFISFLEEARTLCSKNYNLDEWTRFEQGLAERLCFNVAGQFPDFRNLVGRCELIALATSYSVTPSLAAQTEFSCAALAVQLAAEEFRRDRGEYPASLEELVPGYLPEVPKDPFDDGRPIKYNPETRVLYTVGPDRAYDGKLPSKDELGNMSRHKLRNLDHLLRNLDGSPLPIPAE